MWPNTKLRPRVFAKLSSNDCAGLIFDYFTITELISVRNLNRGFVILLAQGNLPSNITIEDPLPFQVG